MDHNHLLAIVRLQISL